MMGPGELVLILQAVVTIPNSYSVANVLLNELTLYNLE